MYRRSTSPWDLMPRGMNHPFGLGYLSCFTEICVLPPWSEPQQSEYIEEGKKYYYKKRREILEEHTPKDLVLLIESFIQ